VGQKGLGSRQAGAGDVSGRHLRLGVFTTRIADRSNGVYAGQGRGWFYGGQQERIEGTMEAVGRVCLLRFNGNASI